ncbi:MAG: type IX secretion system membrane protein PorP/SprF [Flavobacteriales bacterium]|nr:type IX secretion system membrane protein PorP/SprF [Flavobacteriales bacterium]
MRWNVLVFLVISFSCFAQEKVDSTIVSEPEWETKNYSQEDKIFNRSVWTFVDNPALAGFDRKLSVAYRYQMKNLAMGVPNKKGNLTLGFQRHEAFVDLPFGGPKQNWGMGLYYSYEKELQHTYHRVQMARSLRIKLIKEHYLILGFSFGVQFAKLNDWDKLIFGDAIDPRYGLVYPTNEIRPNTKTIISYFDVGLRYYWRRFSFDYAFHQGPNGLGGLAGSSSIVFANRIKAAYHFNVGDGVTISPEMALNITRVNVRTNAASILSAYATVTYKDMAFGQLGITDLNKLSFRAGYQLKDMMVVQFGLSSYLDKTMQRIGGIASIDLGIRYQIKAWNR